MVAMGGAVVSDDRDIYDTGDDDCDMIEAVLSGVHNQTVRLASEIMAAPPRRLDPVEEQALEDCAGDFSAIVEFLESALKRSWGSQR